MSDSDSSERPLDEFRETFREEFLADMQDSESPSEEATDLLDALSEENPSPDKIGERFGDWVNNLSDSDDDA